MRDELERFLDHFDAMAQATNLWMSRTPAEQLDWVPTENPNMKFGDRISRITIRGVFVHIAVGEHGHIRSLRDAADGAPLPPPRDPALTERLNASNRLVEEVSQMHDKNMAVMRGFTEAQLAKRHPFSGGTRTVMDFLWALYAHRSYHLGNIDIYLRQSDQRAPDFYTAIGLGAAA